MGVAVRGQQRAGGVRAVVNGALTLAKDPYRNMVFLIMIMTISRIHQHFRFLTPARPALVVTLLAAAYAYMNPKFLASGNLTRTWPAKAILGMFAAACISVPLGISMGGSGRFIIEEYVKTIVFAFLVIAAIRNTRDLYTVMWAFVIGCGGLAYLSLFVFKMQRVSADGLLRIQNGYSYDSNDIACVAVTGLAIALLMMQVGKGRMKTLAIIIVIGLGATIAKTGSRGGFVGLLAFGAVLLVSLTTVPLAKRLMFLVVTAIALSIAAPPGYWDQMGTIFSPTEDYNWKSPTGRREVFKRGIGYMARNPATGIGIDNFPRAEGTISDRAIAQATDPNLPGIKWSVAHNSHLEVATEMGVVGFAFWLMLVLGGVFAITRLRRRLPKHWAKGTDEERLLYYSTLYIPVAFAAFIFNSSFVSFAYRDLVYALGAFCAGLIVCVEGKLKEAAIAARTPAAQAPPVRHRGPSTPGPVLGPSLRFPEPPARPGI